MRLAFWHKRAARAAGCALALACSAACVDGVTADCRGTPSPCSPIVSIFDASSDAEGGTNADAATDAADAATDASDASIDGPRDAAQDG